MRVATLLVVVASLASLSCFAAKMPPHPAIPDISPTNLVVGVAYPVNSNDPASPGEYWTHQVSRELGETGLFVNVYPMTPDSPPADLVVRVVEIDLDDPHSWCGESFVYTVFTGFVVPGCARSLGYTLSFEAPGATAVPFSFDYESFYLSGWVALLMYPFPSWSTLRADEARRIEHLVAQLAPLLDSLRVEGK